MEHPLKRLTLEEAKGQTLQAYLKFGENLLLRFATGFVTLCTHFESYDIMDYTDGDHPFIRLDTADSKGQELLLEHGFINAEMLEEAREKRRQRDIAWQKECEDRDRAQYEKLRARYETNETKNS